MLAPAGLSPRQRLERAAMDLEAGKSLSAADVALLAAVARCVANGADIAESRRGGEDNALGER
jgi:hypothetical protein